MGITETPMAFARRVIEGQQITDPKEKYRITAEILKHCSL